MTSSKFGPSQSVSWSPDYRSSRRDEHLSWARTLPNPGTNLLAASNIDPDPEENDMSATFDTTKVTYVVLREAVDDHFTNAPTVIGNFTSAAAAVTAARSTDRQWARITIQVTGWE